MLIQSESDIERVRSADPAGLAPVVAQHAHTGEVLMLAYTNGEALRLTLETREMWYFSRSRQRLWRKGETSGNVQRVVSLHLDCDADAVLARVEPTGPSCHSGDWSCFDAPPTLPALSRTIERRAAERPENSYTARLLSDRGLRLKKLGEEAVELAVACVGEDGGRVAEEAADLLYHTLVACLGADVSAAGVLKVLEARLGMAG